MLFQFMTETVKIELNGVILCTKNLKLNETLESIRNKIKDKVVNALFLDKDGNIIYKEDESGFNLEFILNFKIVKLKSFVTSEIKDIQKKIFFVQKLLCNKKFEII